jgi:hypothetical protein
MSKEKNSSRLQNQLENLKKELEMRDAQVKQYQQQLQFFTNSNSNNSSGNNSSIIEKEMDLDEKLKTFKQCYEILKYNYHKPNLNSNNNNNIINNNNNHSIDSTPNNNNSRNKNRNSKSSLHANIFDEDGEEAITSNNVLQHKNKVNSSISNFHNNVQLSPINMPNNVHKKQKNNENSNKNNSNTVNGRYNADENDDADNLSLDYFELYSLSQIKLLLGVLKTSLYQACDNNEKKVLNLTHNVMLSTLNSNNAQYKEMLNDLLFDNDKDNNNEKMFFNQTKSKIIVDDFTSNNSISTNNNNNNNNNNIINNNNLLNTSSISNRNNNNNNNNNSIKIVNSNNNNNNITNAITNKNNYNTNGNSNNNGEINNSRKNSIIKKSSTQFSESKSNTALNSELENNDYRNISNSNIPVKIKDANNDNNDWKKIGALKTKKKQEEEKKDKKNDSQFELNNDDDFNLNKKNNSNNNKTNVFNVDMNNNDDTVESNKKVFEEFKKNEIGKELSTCYENIKESLQLNKNRQREIINIVNHQKNIIDELNFKISEIKLKKANNFNNFEDDNNDNNNDYNDNDNNTDELEIDKKTEKLQKEVITAKKTYRTAHEELKICKEQIAETQSLKKRAMTTLLNAFCEYEKQLSSLNNLNLLQNDSKKSTNNNSAFLSFDD